jgi:hypothetical protein
MKKDQTTGQDAIFYGGMASLMNHSCLRTVTYINWMT